MKPSHFVVQCSSCCKFLTDHIRRDRFSESLHDAWVVPRHDFRYLVMALEQTDEGPLCCEEPEYQRVGIALVSDEDYGPVPFKRPGEV